MRTFAFGELSGPALSPKLVRDERLEREADLAASSASARVGPEGVAAPAQGLSGLGRGEPLPAGQRHDLERHFGWNFLNVRIHADGEAEARAASLGARAFTVGSDIVLGRREQAADGRLLRHELAHVVQQTGQTPVIQRDAIPDPNPSVVSRGGTDVLMMGPWEFAIIRAKTGTLKSNGSRFGGFQKLDKAVNVQGRSVSLAYNVTLQYDNPQGDLEVVSGGGRSHVETSVYPAVAFRVGVVGNGQLTETQKQTVATNKQNRYQETRTRLVNLMNLQVLKEAAAGEESIVPPSAKEFIDQHGTSVQELNNLLFTREWGSGAEMKKFLESYAAELRARGDNAHADGADELNHAVTDEYGAARQRYQELPLQTAEHAFKGVELTGVVGSPTLPSSLQYDKKAGPFTLHAMMAPGAMPVVVCYVAELRSTGKAEYVVGPGDVDAFIANAQYHADYAKMFHTMHPGGLRDYERESWIAQERMFSGDWGEAFKHLGKAHLDAITDPHMLFQVGMAAMGGLIGAEGGAADALASDAAAVDTAAVDAMATDALVTDAAATDTAVMDTLAGDVSADASALRAPPRAISANELPTSQPVNDNAIPPSEPVTEPIPEPVELKATGTDPVVAPKKPGQLLPFRQKPKVTTSEPVTNTSEPQGQGGTQPGTQSPTQPGTQPGTPSATGAVPKPKLSSNRIGSIAEREGVKDFLDNNPGWVDRGAIQNRSGHGLDRIVENPQTGEVRVLEIKGNTARPSPIQERPEEFFATRLMDAQKKGWVSQEFIDRLWDAASNGKVTFQYLRVTGIK